MSRSIDEFEYLVCDGGPHLLLPDNLHDQWRGYQTTYDPFNATLPEDYERACNMISRVGLIAVGKGDALVLADPPVSTWAHSLDGSSIEIYVLESLTSMNVDDLVKRARSETATKTMTDTGLIWRIDAEGLTQMFAGDKPGQPSYKELHIPITRGVYRIFEGHYHPTPNEEVYMYRLVPIEKET